MAFGGVSVSTRPAAPSLPEALLAELSPLASAKFALAIALAREIHPANAHHVRVETSGATLTLRFDEPAPGHGRTLTGAEGLLLALALESVAENPCGDMVWLVAALREASARVLQPRGRA